MGLFHNQLWEAFFRIAGSFIHTLLGWWLKGFVDCNASSSLGRTVKMVGKAVTQLYVDKFAVYVWWFGPLLFELWEISGRSG